MNFKLILVAIITACTGCHKATRVVDLTPDIKLFYFTEVPSPYRITRSSETLVIGDLTGLLETNGWIYGRIANKGGMVEYGCFVLTKSNFLQGLTVKEMESIAKHQQKINTPLKLEDPSFYFGPSSPKGPYDLP